MAECPECGYALGPLETKCPRCAGEKRRAEGRERPLEAPTVRRGGRSGAWLGVGIAVLVVLALWVAAAVWKGWLPVGRRAPQQGAASEPVGSEGETDVAGAEGEAEAADLAVAEAIWQCPFELQAGAPVRVAGWWEGWEFGVEEVAAVPGTEGRETTVRALFADEWTLTGAAGQPLRMPTQNVKGRLVEGAVSATKSWDAEGELQFSGTIGAGTQLQGEGSSGEVSRSMVSEEVGSVVLPDYGLYVRLLWQDQAFELYRSGQFVAGFETMADYLALRQ